MKRCHQKHVKNDITILRPGSFFFVLNGVLTMELEGKEHQIGIQQGIEIPPGSKHQARNDNDSAVEFIVISHPTTRGDRIDLT